MSNQDLRYRVATIISPEGWSESRPDPQTEEIELEVRGWLREGTLAKADVAIAAVIEALAAEAEAEPFMDFTGEWNRSSSEGFADWLRAHLGGTEATG